MTFPINTHAGILIKKAARLFEQVANKNLHKLGVTYAQTIFLVRLWSKDGQSQAELTKSSGLQQPTVVRQLDRMERDKLITRVPNKQDRRSFNFYLTEKAKKVCQKIEGEANMMQDIATSHLSETELKKLNKSLLSVISALEKHLHR